MQAAIAQTNAQTFIPQVKQPERNKDSQSNFKDYMQHTDKAQKDKPNSDKEASELPDKEIAVPEVKPEQNQTPEAEDKEAASLLMEQMAASILNLVVQPEQQQPVQEAVTSIENVMLQQPVQQNAEPQQIQPTLDLPQEELPLQKTDQTVAVKEQAAQNASALESKAQFTVQTASNSENAGESSSEGKLQQSENLKVQAEGEKKQADTPEIAFTEQSAVKSEPLDLSKVNVKVGEGPLQADSPKFAENLADKITANISIGKTEFDLELNPQDLGTIKIKLVFEAGKASILMSCSNPKTENLLLGSAEQIRSMVESQTGSETTVQVKEETHQSQQDMEGRGENPNKRQQEQRQSSNDTVDAAVFLQQLRLGLVETEV